MSSHFDRFAWMNAWVDDPDVTGGVMNTLTVLLKHAREHDGMSWPSQQTIADCIGRSVRSVRDYLCEAGELGYIKKVSRPGNSNAWLPEIPTTPRKPTATPTPATDCHPGNGLPPTPATDCHTPRQSTATPTPATDCHPGSGLPGGRQPTSAHPGNGLPTNRPRTDQRTDQEAAAAASPAHESVAVAEESDPPAQRLLALAQSAGLHLNPFQAETVWSEVSALLSDEDAWRYLRWKLADLAEAEIPRRAQYRYLCQDVDDWLQRQKELSVGRHADRTQPAVKTKPDDRREDEECEKPAPKRVLRLADDGGAWPEASDALRNQMSPDSWKRWIEPLESGGIDDGELVLLAADRFEADYTTDKYADLIDSTLADGLTARIEARGTVEVVRTDAKGAA